MMNNVVFGKTKENLSRKQNKKELFGYHKKTIIQNNFFSENLLPIEVKKIQLIMNNPVFLGLSILEISKMLHDYRYLYSLHRSKRYLCRHCKRCWN